MENFSVLPVVKEALAMPPPTVEGKANQADRFNQPRFSQVLKNVKMDKTEESKLAVAAQGMSMPTPSLDQTMPFAAPPNEAQLASIEGISDPALASTVSSQVGATAAAIAGLATAQGAEPAVAGNVPRQAQPTASIEGASDPALASTASSLVGATAAAIAGLATAQGQAQGAEPAVAGNVPRQAQPTESIEGASDPASVSTAPSLAGSKAAAIAGLAMAQGQEQAQCAEPAVAGNVPRQTQPTASIEGASDPALASTASSQVGATAATIAGLATAQGQEQVQVVETVGDGKGQRQMPTQEAIGSVLGQSLPASVQTLVVAQVEIHLPAQPGSPPIDNPAIPENAASRLVVVTGLAANATLDTTRTGVMVTPTNTESGEGQASGQPPANRQMLSGELSGMEISGEKQPSVNTQPRQANTTASQETISGEAMAAKTIAVEQAGNDMQMAVLEVAKGRLTPRSSPGESPPQAPSAGVAVQSLPAEIKLSEPARLTEAQHPNLINQVTQGIEQMGKSDQRQLRLQLYPESLGKIDVRISSGADGVRIVLTADTPMTSDLLQRHMTDLRGALVNAGVNLAGLSIGHGDGHAQTASHGERQTPAWATNPKLVAAENSIVEETPTLIARHSTSNIDYFV